MNTTNNRNKKSSPASSSGTAGVVAIIVVGVFVLCVIFILAKGLFTSNSAKVPEGLDTATINTNESSMAEVIDESKAEDANTTVSGTDSNTESGVVSDSQAGDVSSSNTDSLGVMYITEYAYLHTEPSNDAENIVCMSPGVEVNVLQYEDNGYVKITFMNIDGQLTGYIYGDYLTTYAAN